MNLRREMDDVITRFSGPLERKPEEKSISAAFHIIYNDKRILSIMVGGISMSVHDSICLVSQYVAFL